MTRELQDREYPAPEFVRPDVENVDPQRSLFDIVFSVDPVTGLPEGDVAMFLNKNVNPDIKRFIELNLHSPVTVSGDAAGDFSGLSDDDILQFTRGNDESYSSYRSRVYDSLMADRAKYLHDKKSQQKSD